MSKYNIKDETNPSNSVNITVSEDVYGINIKVTNNTNDVIDNILIDYFSNRLRVLRDIEDGDDCEELLVLNESVY